MRKSKVKPFWEAAPWIATIVVFLPWLIGNYLMIMFDGLWREFGGGLNLAAGLVVLEGYWRYRRRSKPSKYESSDSEY